MLNNRKQGAFLTTTTVASVDSRAVLVRMAKAQGAGGIKKAKSSNSGASRSKKRQQDPSTSGSRAPTATHHYLTTSRGIKLAKQKGNDSPGLSLGSLDSNGTRIRPALAQGNSLKQLGFHLGKDLQFKRKPQQDTSQSPFKSTATIQRKNITIATKYMDEAATERGHRRRSEDEEDP